MSVYECAKGHSICRLPVFVGLLVAGGAGATNVELCVKSDADLASALDQAQTVAVTAKIVQHNLTVQNKAYDLKNTVWQSALVGVQAGSEFLGGYTGGCAARDIGAGNTLIIDSATPAFLFIYPRGSVTIEGLTFNVQYGLNIGLGSGQMFALPSGSTILIRRDAFINGSNNANGLYFAYSQAANNDSTILVVDTLIANNTGLGGYCALQFQVGAGAPEFDVVNSTVVHNDSTNAGACLDNFGTGAGTLSLYNNIFYGTSGFGSVDLKVATAQVVQVDNMIGSRAGPAASVSSGNLGSDPNLDANYIPQAPSPAINSGSNSVPGGLPPTDLDGNPRTIGSSVDRGAYETDQIFAGDFETP